MENRSKAENKPNREKKGIREKKMLSGNEIDFGINNDPRKYLVFAYLPAALGRRIVGRHT